MLFALDNNFPTLSTKFSFAMLPTKLQQYLEDRGVEFRAYHEADKHHL